MKNYNLSWKEVKLKSRSDYPSSMLYSLESTFLKMFPSGVMEITLDNIKNIYNSSFYIQRFFSMLDDKQFSQEYKEINFKFSNYLIEIDYYLEQTLLIFNKMFSTGYLRTTVDQPKVNDSIVEWSDFQTMFIKTYNQVVSNITGIEEEIEEKKKQYQAKKEKLIKEIRTLESVSEFEISALEEQNIRFHRIASHMANFSEDEFSLSI